jgi:hypothetical protein
MLQTNAVHVLSGSRPHAGLPVRTYAQARHASFAPVCSIPVSRQRNIVLKVFRTSWLHSIPANQLAGAHLCTAVVTRHDAAK